MVNDPFDGRPEDTFLEEVELTTNLIVAATAADGHRLSRERIDEVLGIPLGR